MKCFKYYLFIFMLLLLSGCGKSTLLRCLNFLEISNCGKVNFKGTNLLDKKNNFPYQLSVGQKQRVAIIRTFIMNPEIILTDEPTSALAPEMVLKVLEFIKNISFDGITMIIVSHELNFVRSCANKVLYLDKGKISFLDV